MNGKIAVWTAIAVAVYAALCWLAHSSLYFPMRYPEGWWTQQQSLGAEDVSIVAADGVKLHGWWVAAATPEIATLFLHGNAGNVTHRMMALRAIREAGSSVLMLDYRGYGKSEGSPSEKGLYRDAQAAYEWLLQKGYAAQRIVLHGESLGSAVAVDLAARRPSMGVVLEAPFSSASAVAGTILPGVGRMLMWGFDSKSKISRVHAPVMIIHGSEDEVIPLRLGQELFAAANEPKTLWVVESAHHNDLGQVAGSAYRERLAQFYAAAKR